MHALRDVAKKGRYSAEYPMSAFCIKTNNNDKGLFRQLINHKPR